MEWGEGDIDKRNDKKINSCYCALTDEAYLQRNELKNPHLYPSPTPWVFADRQRFVYSCYFNDTERFNESGMNNMVDQETQEITMLIWCCEGPSACYMSAVQKALVEYLWILTMAHLNLRIRGRELVAGLGPEPESIKIWPQLPVTWGFISTGNEWKISEQRIE